MSSKSRSGGERAKAGSIAPSKNSDPPPVPPRKSPIPPPIPREPLPLTLSLDDFDEGSIAGAFDALLSDAPSGCPGTADVDLAPVRELFAQLAANHMRHVRDFMIDVKWGEAAREWIDLCLPLVVSLSSAADKLDLKEVSSGLNVFAQQLRLAAETGGERTVTGVMREQLLETYEKLALTLPQAFALDRDRSAREAVIVHALLLSVPDVRKVTIDKLHAAGVATLEVLFRASASELAQVAGISECLSERIIERFRTYRSELTAASPQDARAVERERLNSLLLQLRKQHERYETAALAWSAEAKADKREWFRAREETWLAIRVLLARFGEVERLGDIERVPFSQRVVLLEGYIEEARDKYRLET